MTRTILPRPGTASRPRRVRPLVLAVAAAVGASVLAVSTLASAASVKPTAPNSPAQGVTNEGSPTPSPSAAADGINPAAHTVTTHNGKVIGGITFADGTRASGSRQLNAADPEQLFCDGSWHYITAGGANTYWKPNSQRQVMANGNRDADWWNEQFLACWKNKPGWDANMYVFLANATGNFVQYMHFFLYADVSAAGSNSPNWEMLLKFQVCDFDGNWKFFAEHDSDTGHQLNTYRDPQSARVTSAEPTLNGNNLFKVDPPVHSGTTGRCAH